MTDIHSHCLPCVDDGAKNVSDSLIMLRDAKRNGTEIVVATPHIRPFSEEDIADAVIKRKKAYDELMRAATNDIPIIKLGFEVNLSAEITQFENFKDMRIENTNLMLTELPFAVWDNYTKERLELIISSGVTPIIAHIERYLDIRRNVEKILSLDGVIFQINADAFLHFKTRRFAVKLIKSGRRVVIGSDMHDPYVRKSRMCEAYKKTAHKGESFKKAFMGLSEINQSEDYDEK